MPSFEEADKLVSGLIDDWCGRRALGPLRQVLPAWPYFGLTDSVAGCLEGLRAARALAKDEITPNEGNRLSQAIAILTQAIQER